MISPVRGTSAATSDDIAMSRIHVIDI